MTPAEAAAYTRYYTSRGRGYGVRDPIYTKGYHRGLDLNLDAIVPAMRAGVVAASGRQPAVGWWVAVKVTGTAQFDVYCHMYEPTAAPVGRMLAKGQNLGRPARNWVERPADNRDYWTGLHVHLVVTNAADGGWNTARRDYDPVPIIAAELAALSGGEGTVFVPEIDYLEDDVTAFWQRRSNGTLAAQRSPGEPITTNVSLTLWQGYEANGAKFKVLDDAAWDALVATSPKAPGETATGAFYQISTATADVTRRGVIYWQERPNGPLVKITDSPVWGAFERAGARLYVVEPSTIDALSEKFGVFDKPQAGVINADLELDYAEWAKANADAGVAAWRAAIAP